MKEFGSEKMILEQFDMLPLQYRHIEHMHEGVDKMTSMRTYFFGISFDI